jgi:hypothetical protein
VKYIVDGKRYDTETATKLCDVRIPFSRGALFRTSRLSYFLYLESTVMPDDLGYVRPVSEKEALRLTVSQAGVDAAEQFFPDIIKDA